MGEPHLHTTATFSRNPVSVETSTVPTPSSPPPPPPPPPLKPRISLVEPTRKKKHRPRPFRVLRSIFRSFPITTPACKLSTLPVGLGMHDTSHRGHVRNRVTGTLFGYRKGKISFSLQENPATLPTMVVELALQTQALQKEMSMGMVRIALECEKKVEKQENKVKLLEEPVWTMYCNGMKGADYSGKREANDDDLRVMEHLKAVSMGAGVLCGKSDVEGPDGELAYVRAHFEHIVGSKDSETLYMLSPDGSPNKNGPELTIFFVRV